jgi:hypothetical protein
MAERLDARTRATCMVARVRFPVPARPTFSVEKLLFSVTLLRGTFSSTAIEIIKMG